MEFLSGLGERIRGGRVIVVIAGIVGIALFVQRAVGSSSVWRAFMEGCAAAFALMIVLGLAHGYWRGREIDEAQIPGGGGIKLAKAAERPLLLTNRRVSAQMEALSKRILAVEQAVAELTQRTGDPPGGEE